MKSSLNCHYFCKTTGLHFSLPDFWHSFLKEQSRSSVQKPPDCWGLRGSGRGKLPHLVQMAHTQSSLLAAHIDTQFTTVYHCSLAEMSRSTIWTCQDILSAAPLLLPPLRNCVRTNLELAKSASLSFSGRGGPSSWRNKHIVQAGKATGGIRATEKKPSCIKKKKKKESWQLPCCV